MPSWPTPLFLDAATARSFGLGINGLDARSRCCRWRVGGLPSRWTKRVRRLRSSYGLYSYGLYSYGTGKKTEKIRLEVDRQRGLLDEVKKRIENLIAPEFSPKDLGVVTGEWKTNPITAVAPAEDQPLCPDAGLEISSMIVC